jgi:hypothetical protein
MMRISKHAALTAPIEIVDQGFEVILGELEDTHSTLADARYGISLP